MEEQTNETRREVLMQRTQAQLLQEAAHTYGLPVNKQMSKTAIVDLILLATKANKGHVEVVEKDDEGQSVRGPKRGYARIVVSRDHRDKKQHPVFAGMNGVGYLIPRGKEVDVPAFLVPILKQAVEIRYEQDNEAEGMHGVMSGSLVAREVDLYPFNIVGWGAETEKYQKEYARAIAG